MILNMLISIENPMQSIILINPQPWEVIIPMMMTLFPYVVMNAKAHHMIFRFLMKILI